jgi:hypothetical protein
MAKAVWHTNPKVFTNMCKKLTQLLHEAPKLTLAKAQQNLGSMEQHAFADIHQFALGLLQNNEEVSEVTDLALVRTSITQNAPATPSLMSSCS